MTSSPTYSAYLAPIELRLELPTPVYGAMLAIWQLRPQLQRWFPLHRNRAADYVRFLGWCTMHGRKEYALLRELPDWDEALNRPMSLPRLRGDEWGLTFTVGMFLLGVARHRNAISPVLASIPERKRLAHWYWRGRRLEHHMPPPPDWQLALLKQEFSTTEAFVGALRRSKADAHMTPAQIAEGYGLNDVLDRWQNLPDDISGHPRVDLILPSFWRMAVGKLPLQITRTLKLMRHRLTSLPDEPDIYRVMQRMATYDGVGLEPAYTDSGPESHSGMKMPQGNLPFGVNLFGYAKGELGIGEDVRMVARALKAVDVPCCIINVQPGADVSQHDTSAEDLLSQQPRYAINLFCMTGIEHVRFLCENGAQIFQSRYNIGLWPWELPRWPSTWQHAYATVDEIWGISRYTAAAYVDAAVPVEVMPLAVTAKPVADIGRLEFGLPDDTYLFIYAFDFNSTLARKNPDGVISAFQKAFPKGQGKSVGLVLKVSHVRTDDRRWRRLIARIQTDPRIHLIDRMLRRREILALYRCCDCYVSLHRSEGFGRTIAEALLLGKQVICTDYSGNRDFCRPERVGLVGYTMRPLKAGEYFCAHGQVWAEPDIEHAATLMRQLVESPLPADEPGFDHGYQAAGSAYRKRLEKIYLENFLGR
jgi:glycosyltransferase involved in cell wall biosynthesis